MYNHHHFLQYNRSQKTIDATTQKNKTIIPLAGFFRWTGGAPIDRSKSSDTVSAIAKIFQERQKFRLTIAPEGTRKKVEKWKTGFYHIAKQAHVLIVMVAFDFGKKEIKVSEPQWPTEDQAADFTKYEAFFEGVVGKVR